MLSLLFIMMTSFAVGFSITSWFLGTYRDRFASKVEYHINMASTSLISLFTLAYYI